MKRLLSVSVCQRRTDSGSDALFDGLELVYAQPDESAQALILRCTKETKCKYIFIAERGFFISDLRTLLNATEKANEDIISFNGGEAFRKSVFKGLNAKLFSDPFAVRAYAALNSKSLLKLDCTPFNYCGGEGVYPEADKDSLLGIVKEFGRVKAKLRKDVYSFVFELICNKLIRFYMLSMLAVRDKKTAAEDLVEFDRELKKEIVLYLALEKRFAPKKLSSLREKGFKISFITANKFKKLLK